MKAGHIAMAAVLAGALALVGCGGNANSTNAVSNSTTTSGSNETQSESSQDGQTQVPKQQTEANIGDVIPVSSSHGTYKLTVDSFELNDAVRAKYDYDGNINPDHTIGILYLTVENVSYDDKYNSGQIDLEPDMYLEDQDGITLNAESSGYDVGQYEVGAASFFSCLEGEVRRVAVPYIVPKTIPSVTVVTPDTTVTIAASSFGAPAANSVLAYEAKPTENRSPVNVGQPITVSTDLGNYVVTVDSLDTNQTIRSYYTSTDPLPDDKTIAILCLTVQNVSYNDEYNEEFVSLQPEVSLVDSLGITLHPESASYDYRQYAAGSLFYDIAKGQTKRVGATYIIGSDETTATVVVGDSYVNVPVTKG